MSNVPAKQQIQQEIVQCACGCGRWIERYYQSRGYWYERIFVHNHHRRGKTNNDCQKQSLKNVMQTTAWREAYDAGMARRKENHNWQLSVSTLAAKDRWTRRPRHLQRPRKKQEYSYRDYPDTFNDQLRTSIRKRDGFRCRICKVYQYGLSVHHIDTNKQNSDPLNLVSLCRSCHMKVHIEIKRTGQIVQFLM